MAVLHVAVVSRDPDLRDAAARAFDRAPSEWRVRLYEEPPSDCDVIVSAPDVKVPGAIQFDPGDSDRVISDIAASVSTGAQPAIVVTGSAGGTGTTTLALHLARALARDAPTCVIDCSPDRGAAYRLGIDATSCRRYDAATESPELFLSALPTPGGFRLIVPDDCRRDLDALLPLCRQNFQRTLLDVPVGEALTETLEHASAGVLVMTPTRPSAIKAREIIATHPATSWAIVINRLGPGGETPRVELQRMVGARVALDLPCTPGLRDAEDDGSLLSAFWSRYLMKVSLLAATLTRT